MKNLKHLEKVESMIAEIKAMGLSLPEKMYYVYHLFLEDFTEGMKEELRKDITLRHDLEQAKEEKKTEKAKELENELQERDKKIATELPKLVDRIKAEVTEYAQHFEGEKWKEKEGEKKKKEEKLIKNIQDEISEDKQ